MSLTIDEHGRRWRHGGDPGLVVADGLHPSGAQYAAWAELILPAALEALAG